ncbi:hypothetical protein ACOSQ4_029537 [Xanthoceras sorbifolium]
MAIMKIAKNPVCPNSQPHQNHFVYPTACVWTPANPVTNTAFRSYLLLTNFPVPSFSLAVSSLSCQFLLRFVSQREKTKTTNQSKPVFLRSLTPSKTESIIPEMLSRFAPTPFLDLPICLSLSRTLVGANHTSARFCSR